MAKSAATIIPIVTPILILIVALLSSRLSRHTDFISVLKSISNIYAAEPDKVTKNAKAVRQHLEKTLAFEGSPSLPPEDLLPKQAAGILSMVDKIHGGIGQAPKFPNASMLETLWRHWQRSGSSNARDAALHWLRALINGGIYDHLGGGLSRYTVDVGWLVPHFEKMLYDNAQLIRALIWAHGEIGEDLFRVRIEETIEWLVREMKLEGGGFSSSLDADSEGEEGRFYVWDQNRINELLGDHAAEFCENYDVSGSGNWEGKNILNRLDHHPSRPDWPIEIGLAKSRDILLRERASRIRPERDDKVLADWNGLMIRALAEAAMQFDRPDWLSLASDAFNFIVESMSRDDRLAHAWRDGVTTYPALSSDYGTMIGAAVSLYLPHQDKHYLDLGYRWLEILDNHYADSSGGYYYSADDSADVLLRTRHEQDDAAPSASASILESLSRLALVSDNPELTEKTTQMAAAMWGRIKEIPMAASGTVNAIDTIQSPKKLVLVNPAKEMLKVIRKLPDPSRLDLIVRDTNSALELIPVTQSVDADESGKQNTATAYLCHGPVCLPPITNAEELQKALQP